MRFKIGQNALFSDSKIIESQIMAKTIHNDLVDVSCNRKFCANVDKNKM